jgi:NADH dehydrogenase
MPDFAKRIVIVNGGFAGVIFARHLERLRLKEMELAALSVEKHLVCPPMLREVTGRTMSSREIVIPGRELIRRTRCLEAPASRIDIEKSDAHDIS